MELPAIIKNNPKGTVIVSLIIIAFVVCLIWYIENHKLKGKYILIKRAEPSVSPSGNVRATGLININEIDIFDKDGNSVLNKKDSVSMGGSHENNPATKIVDKDISTYATTASEDPPFDNSWFKIKLDTASEISTIKITNRPNFEFRLEGIQIEIQNYKNKTIYTSKVLTEEDVGGEITIDVVNNKITTV